MSQKHYTLDYEYKLYFMQLKVDPAELHPEQAQQLWQFFKAGCRSTLRIVDMISKINDPILAKQLINNLRDQTNDKN